MQALPIAYMKRYVFIFRFSCALFHLMCNRCSAPPSTTFTSEWSSLTSCYLQLQATSPPQMRLLQTLLSCRSPIRASCLKTCGIQRAFTRTKCPCSCNAFSSPYTRRVQLLLEMHPRLLSEAHPNWTDELLKRESVNWP